MNQLENHNNLFIGEAGPGKAFVSIKPFVQKCADKEADVSELDDYIELWHKSDTGIPLKEFLGLTESEYAEWGRSNDNIFVKIIEARRSEKNRTGKQ